MHTSSGVQVWRAVYKGRGCGSMFTLFGFILACQFRTANQVRYDSTHHSIEHHPYEMGVTLYAAQRIKESRDVSPRLGIDRASHG